MLSFVGALLLLIPGTLVGKAHVPLGYAQVCKKSGKVKNVDGKMLQKLMGKGACRLTACAFNDVADDSVITQYIFLPGGECDATDANGDGFCDATGAPSDVPSALSAVNVTPACTDPF